MSYRPRSRTPEKREDKDLYRPPSRRYSPPPLRERPASNRQSPVGKSGISSNMTSKTASRRSSPQPQQGRVASPTRSRESPELYVAPPRGGPRDGPRDGHRVLEHTPELNYDSPMPDAPRAGGSAVHTPLHEIKHETREPSIGASDPAPGIASAPRSPPRGPAALRAPPTGPREPTRTPGGQSGRADAASPSFTPSGPRFNAAHRGGFSGLRRGSSWQGQQPRSAPGTGANSSSAGAQAERLSIPTGPRSGGPGSSVGSAANSPVAGPQSASKPFNPPTGPAGHQAMPAGPARPTLTLAQQLMNSLPPLVPGGKLDPSLTPVTTGITREIEPRMRRLREEEEKAREELHARQDRLRENVRQLDRLQREANAAELRSRLAEESLRMLTDSTVGTETVGGGSIGGGIGAGGF